MTRYELQAMFELKLKLVRSHLEKRENIIPLFTEIGRRAIAL
jgi:hypothetical protein